MVIIIISLIFLLLNYLFKKPITIRIVKKNMLYKFKSIKLDELEKCFLNVFLKNKEIPNSLLIDLIGSKIDVSQKSRIKNSTIDSLNLKLSFVTNSKFHIKKSPSSQDRRYYSYKLLEKI
jgi:hypothetical protein